MGTICGADCNACGMKQNCKGCAETNGHPLGGNCVVAECYHKGGEKVFCEYKSQLIKEFNALAIPDMPKITELYQLCGAYINMEYSLSNSDKVKLLADNNIYLGNQVAKCNSEKCYGIVADDSYLLVCEYGLNGTEPQVIIYKKR